MLYYVIEFVVYLVCAIVTDWLFDRGPGRRK